MNALRVRCREQEAHRAALGHAEKGGSIDLRGVENGVKVIHSLVERRDMGGGVGESGAALVPHDESGRFRQLFGDGCDRTCRFVDEVDVTEPTGVPHERCVAIAEHAVRKAHRTVARVMDPLVGHIDILAA
jgi:hypothetical protein